MNEKLTVYGENLCCEGGANRVLTNGLNPQAYLTDVLARINDHKITRLDELLPWNWKPAPPVAADKLAA